MATNFLQFDPYKNNMVLDATWSSSPFRLNGGTRGKVASSDFNKLMYQVTTMVAALAQMMEEKGAGTPASLYGVYTMNDASLTTLKRNLHNIMTRADMSPYATISSIIAGYTPLHTVVTKTADYSMSSSTDFYKTFQMNSTSVHDIFLPVTTPALAGPWVMFENINTGQLTIRGVVNGVTNPTIDQYEMMFVYWDGAFWRGWKVANTMAAPSVPAGAVFAMAGYSSIIPGYLLCDGSTYASGTYPSLYAAIGNDYGGTYPNFKVPDFRGYFLRGVNTVTGGVDPDGIRAMNNIQLSQSGAHTHIVTVPAAGWSMGIANGDPGYRENWTRGNLGISGESTADDSMGTQKQDVDRDFTSSTNSVASDETRPINKPVYYIIKT